MEHFVESFESDWFYEVSVNPCVECSSLVLQRRHSGESEYTRTLNLISLTWACRLERTYFNCGCDTIQHWHGQIQQNDVKRTLLLERRHSITSIDSLPVIIPLLLQPFD